MSLFTRHDIFDLRLACRACRWVIWARIERRLPRLACRVRRRHLTAGDIALAPPPAALLERVRWAAGVAARRFGGERPCFLEAITARRLLAGYGYDVGIRLEIERTVAGIRAHARLAGSEDRPR